MKNWPLVLLALTWLAAICTGTGALWVYDSSPGKDTSIPSVWPSQSRMSLSLERPTLVLFAHPDCPCTRASIEELSVLMTHCQKKVDASVVFLQPKGSRENWLHTDLWRSAEAIPGVTVRADEDGLEAGYFQVTTSGHVVLYDVHGKLLFSGGITSSRGHYGDNEGLSAVTNLLHHETVAVIVTPVFGCSLLDPNSKSSVKSPACTR